MAGSLTLNLTTEIRAALRNLLTTAGRLEDYARIVDHFPDEPFGDLDEFRRSVYEPLRDSRSVTTGPGDSFNLDLEDSRLVFDVIHGISEGWAGGTPWMAMTPGERSAVDRLLDTLRLPQD
jgi:hypothetical protein